MVRVCFLHLRSTDQVLSGVLEGPAERHLLAPHEGYGALVPTIQRMLKSLEGSDEGWRDSERVLKNPPPPGFWLEGGSYLQSWGELID